MKIAGAEIEIKPDGLLISHYPDGEVHAYPHDSDSYRKRVFDLGYTDTLTASHEHEITHHLLANMLRLSCSPTLRGIAQGGEYYAWREEEAAVLAIQRFAKILGIDLMEVARAISS